MNPAVVSIMARGDGGPDRLRQVPNAGNEQEFAAIFPLEGRWLCRD